MSTRVKTQIVVNGKLVGLDGLDGLTALTAQQIAAVGTAISQPTEEHIADVLNTAYELQAMARDAEQALHEHKPPNTH